jgi:hypothetical protein
MSLSRCVAAAVPALAVVGCIQWPTLRPLQAQADSLLDDGFFTRMSRVWDGSGSYLEYFWGDFSGGTGSIEIVPGGVEGGILRLHGSGATNFPAARTLPRENARFIRGEYLKLGVRLRRHAAGPSSGILSIAIAAGTADGTIGWTTGSTHLTFSAATVAGWTLDEWVEDELTMQMAPSSSTDQHPRVIVSISHVFDTDPSIEIDAVVLARVPAP